MDSDQQPEMKRKDTGPIMFLSLFLLLLAFFILLNAISTYEETRSRQVIESVASTFRTEISQRNVSEILISTLGPVPEPEELMAEVERLWITAIPLAKVEVLTEGRVMQFEMPMRDLFIAGRTDIRRDRKDLIKTTALALAARMEGFVPEMQFVIGVEDLQRVKTTRSPIQPIQEIVDPEIPDEDTTPNLFDPTRSLLQPQKDDDRNQSFARVNNFAKAVVEAGAPPSGVSIGLLKGATDTIRMRFYIHPIDEAYNSFSNVKE